MEMTETLCIHCGNACNSGCSWSERLKPVKGWKAEKTKNGYCVISCPEHTEDRRPEHFDTGAVLRLAEAMAMVLNEDYIHGTKAMRKTIERELRSGPCRNLMQLADTEGVISRLREMAKSHDEERDRKWSP